jgi:adenylate cyclase
VERRLAAILAADVVGYSRLIEADEAGTLAAIKSHREALIDPKIAQYHGRIVKLMGDGLLAEFPSAVEAALCAVEIQHKMAERNADVAEERRVTCRIGINIGDIVVEDDDIFGDGVNIAARLEGLADPGGICISRPVHTQIKGKLDLTFEHLGEKKVKNIAEPVSVYRVNLDGKSAALVTPIVKEAAATKRRSRWPAIVVGFVLSVISVAGIVWWQISAPDVEPASEANMAFPLPDKPSIAVLPFANLSDDPSQEQFADGITEDIITDLSRLPYLFVIARNSSFTYKGQAVKVQQVVEELGVRYVLEGSIQKADNRVRVTAQLVDAISGHHVWAERYDRSLDDIFAVQDEITQRIAATLVGYGGRLNETQLQMARRKPPESLEAYDYYLLGSDHKHRFTQEDVAKARQYYEKAIQLDPNFARAHLGLAWTHQHDLWLGWSESPERSLALFREHAQRAVDLDELDGEAYLALGQAYFIDGDVSHGAAAFDRARDLAPNSADVLAILGWNLPSTLGRSEQAVELVERAMRLNPHYPDWYRHALGYALYHTEQYAEAAQVLKEVENPTVETALYLAASSAQLEQDEQARLAAKEVLRLDPAFSATRYMQNVGYKNPTAMEELLDGVRMAGLPE